MSSGQVFIAAAVLSQQLEADWGNGRSAMCGRHGIAVAHFEIHVVDNQIVIRCKTAAAYGWHAIRKAVNRGQDGFTVRVEWHPAYARSDHA